MSRVHSDQKFMNTSKHGPDVTGPSKVTRIHADGEDYHNATSLRSWLFMKYDMGYTTYRSKSKSRRYELRREFEEDTGRVANELFPKDDWQKDFCYTNQIVDAIRNNLPAAINDSANYKRSNKDGENVDCNARLFFLSDGTKWNLIIVTIATYDEWDYDPFYTEIRWLDNNDAEYLDYLIENHPDDFLMNLAEDEKKTERIGKSIKILDGIYHASTFKHMAKKDVEKMVLADADAWHTENVNNGTYC